MNANKTTIWLPVFLLFCSGLFYVQNMAGAALWADEGFSIFASQRPSFGEFLEFIEHDLHPPLYFVILRGWDDIASEQPFALRTLGFWSSLLTATLTWKLATELFGTRAGAVAVILLATSDLVLSLTATTRNYSPYMLFAALSSWAYWHFMLRKSFGWGVAYGLSALMLIYTHYWGGFILIAQGLHAILYHRQRIRELILVGICVALGYLPWLPVFVARLTSGGVPESNVTREGHAAALEIDISGLQVVFFQLFGIPEVLFAGLALAGLVGTFSVQSWRDYLPTKETALAGLWLMVPVILPIISGLLGYDLLTHRPLIAMIPALAILVGHVLSQMSNWQYGLFLGIIICNNLLTSGATPPERGPWWAVGEFLSENMSAHDTLFIESDIYAYTIEKHAELANASFQQVIRGRQIRDSWPGETESMPTALLAKTDAVWLVEFTDHYDTRSDLRSLGFTPTTPTLEFGFFLVDNIHITRFARQTENAMMTIFGTDMGLQSAEYYSDDDRLFVELNWKALRDPNVDYTISVFLLSSEGEVVRIHDSYPLNNWLPTSTWTAGYTYFDFHNLSINGLPSDEYQLGVKVYTLRNFVIQSPCEDSTCEYIVLGVVTIPD